MRILPEIAGDLAQAAKWYDKEGARSLGDRFIAAFYSHLLSAASNPGIHPKAYGEFRRILLQPFPYKLYFKVANDERFLSC